MKLTIGYFYPAELNLYGDTGNIEILKYRAARRNISCEILNVDTTTKINEVLMKNIDLIFMGGGPDSSQKNMYEDLMKNKGPYLKDFINNGGVTLTICGSYQLLGNYYKSADGSILEGVGAFDIYTQHFGNNKPRCIGNTVCEINPDLRHSLKFNENNKIGINVVGFENHGGRTYLGKGMQPFGKVLKGFGNNGEDLTEGVWYQNSIGTYLHGPILSKNPHIADFLIAQSLNLEVLDIMSEDDLIKSAHTASKELKQ